MFSKHCSVKCSVRDCWPAFAWGTITILFRYFRILSLIFLRTLRLSRCVMDSFFFARYTRAISAFFLRNSGSVAFFFSRYCLSRRRFFSRSMVMLVMKTQQNASYVASSMLFVPSSMATMTLHFVLFSKILNNLNTTYDDIV